MTIGECLDVIRKTCLGHSVDAMSRVGMDVLKKIKYEYFIDAGDYPRKGWFIYFEDGLPFLYHSKNKIPVDLSIAWEEENLNESPLMRRVRQYRETQKLNLKGNARLNK